MRPPVAHHRQLRRPCRAVLFAALGCVGLAACGRLGYVTQPEPKPDAGRVKPDRDASGTPVDASVDAAQDAATDAKVTPPPPPDAHAEAGTGPEAGPYCGGTGYPCTGRPIITGSTATATDHGGSTCGGGRSPEFCFDWSSPVGGFYAFNTIGSSFDTVLTARKGGCEGKELVCNDNGTEPEAGLASSFTQDLLGGEHLGLVVDGVIADGSVNSGNFELNVINKCPGTSLGSAVGAAVVRGQTVGAGNSLAGSCGGQVGSDIGYTWTAPSDGYFDFNTIGSSLDTVIYARDGSCGGTELFCNDDADIFEHSSASGATRQLAQGQEIALSVDSALDGGAYQLNILKKCPGASLGSRTGASVAAGSALGQDDSFFGTCGGKAGQDVEFVWNASVAGTYRFDATGSDYVPVVYARDDGCDGPELGCSTTGQLDLTLTAAQTVVIFLDGNAATGAGNYALGISKQ